MGEQVPHLYRPRQEMAKGCLNQGPGRLANDKDRACKSL